jgi:Fic family protein
MIAKYQIAEANNQKLLSMRPLSKETLQSLKDYYRIGLTFSSNAMEGNSLTESETKVVIEDGLTVEGKPLRDVFEAVGHAKAYDHIYQLSTHKIIKEEDVLRLHNLFYSQIDNENAGKYRTVSVFISGSKYSVTPPQKIPAEMKKFVAWFNKQELNMHPVEFAALVHKKFVFIHPFIDGNGRLARLLMNLALLRNEYSIALIPAVLRHEYIETLEVAHVDDTRFKEFIADRIIATQMDLIRLLSESGGVNLTNGGVNLTNGGVNRASEAPIGGVNSIDKQLLEMIIKRPGMNTPKLANSIGISLRTTQRYLKTLSEAGKVEYRGAPKNGGYYLVD